MTSHWALDSCKETLKDQTGIDRLPIEIKQKQTKSMSHLQRNIIKLKCQFSPQNRLEGKYYFAIKKNNTEDYPLNQYLNMVQTDI